jgi:hypothetical protein
MCCETCPRYANCEEEGYLDESCCVSCPDFSSCRGEDASEEKETGEETDDGLKEEKNLKGGD